jgi:DNA replication protein DnaC
VQHLRVAAVAVGQVRQVDQLGQVRELAWLEQNFNLILMGPSGTGKTYIAAGLCFDAVAQGYRAYFKTMEELVKVLKMKEITRKAATEYKRILKAHLLVIDDIMMFPVSEQDAVGFFNLINELHERASLIITTNKSPKQWAEVLKDTVLTTALLDRILYRCEIIKLTGNSYRMENRQTIFENNNKNN